MEKNTKKLRVICNVLSVLVWAGLTTLCVQASVNSESFMFSRDGNIYLTFSLFPYVMVGALYGYFIGMISFVMSFVTTLVLSPTGAYNMAIYLVATLCFALFAQYGFFAKVKKTIVAALCTLCATSLAEFACLSVIKTNEYNFENIGNIIDYFTRDMVTILFVAVFCYFLFGKLPDIFKIIFPIGVSYTTAFKENKELQKNLRKTRLSVKISTIVIAVELVLGLAVAVYMMVLFPDLKDMFVGGMKRNEAIEQSLLDDEASEETGTGTDINDVETGDDAESNDNEGKGTLVYQREKLLSEIQNMDYTFDYVALGFDIKMILLMLCVGVPMAAFANFFTKVTIGGPIGNMSDFLLEYANADDDMKLEVGHKVDKIIVGSRDEIKILHESMKTTVHSVEDYIGRIKEEQELEKELEVAQKASEAKSSFLSNMSHEIRTPINAVLGMNEMILREASDDQILEYASNVKSAGNSLLGIVNDILDFSKIEAGKMDILPVQYHLGSTINDLINMVDVKAKDKGLKLELNIDETLPTQLIGDEIRIKQCVTNILSNAVKYTEEGTVTLEVGYRKVDDINIMLGFRVKDTGIGIKEEDINKLYSPFERIEETRNRSIEGTGLGMSIVKKLLALMDSRLEVKSVYGEGSDFSFEVKQEVVSWEEIGDFKKKYKEYLQSLEKYHEKFKAPDGIILVVDDTPMNLTVVKGLLKTTEIQVDTAESGPETLEKVKAKKYDAIFIDHRMPGMDGIETLAAMKELDQNQNLGVPCIALTANAGEGAKEEYLKAGFDDYLSKPVDGLVLEEMLERYLPDGKVLHPGDVGYGENSDKEAGKADNKKEEDQRENLYKKLEGVDYEQALKNCGSLDILNDVIHEFYLAIDSKSSDIEAFAASKDYRNFTVAVHALKSSARLIGAMDLSEKAAYLEKCGNDENQSEIENKSGELLVLYRSYKDKLAPAVQTEDKKNLPEIPEEELGNAFSDMKELLEAYDFDTADGIMKMLEGYSIPASLQDKYNKVKQLMAAVDRDALLEIL
ncbi:response regulator [Butyrivibrio sp. AE3006]|uniref:response regulator n=1 Tax=Butyrivibrio sp. AE3006 TaxID=1280673 RepID=UPI0004049081|nr:response regulator [Butyrivibrio sp. AE3006]